MRFAALGRDRRPDLSALFHSTFLASEGEDEARLIGELAARLAADIDDADVLCFGALQDGALLGAIFLTRLRFDDPSLVYMLAPVAVATAHQRAGIGRALIRFGLDAVARRGAAVATTYGDPAYYGKCGFAPLSESVIRAPMELSMPFGWQGVSLNGAPIAVRHERPGCVEAFRHPAYW